MGAAASVKLVYSDAMSWFAQYFDAGDYVEDFNSMAKDSDGGVSYDEIQDWMRGKALNDSSWRTVISNSSIFTIAHTQASKTTDIDHTPDKIINPSEFKAFLIHLFVLSILWVHFKNADNWAEGMDVGNETLNLDEFRLACRTFSSAQANERFTEDQILKDFVLLDTDRNGSVDFMEVCQYCSHFVDTSFADKFSTAVTPKHVKKSFNADDELTQRRRRASLRESELEEIMVSTKDGENNSISVRSCNSESAERALDIMAREMEKNLQIASFEEIKVSTERALGVLSQCGYQRRNRSAASYNDDNEYTSL